MLARRFVILAVALFGAVVIIDLLWLLLDGPTGSLAYGLVDEPAHLATCAVALLALMAVAGPRVSRPFVVAALLAAVVIDLDHLPQQLGWEALATGTPRPAAHSALFVLVLLLAASPLRGKRRAIVLGIAFGIAAHMLRDVATGPGVALAWPLSSAVVNPPYLGYLIVLGSLVAFIAVRRSAGGESVLESAPPGGVRVSRSLAIAAVAITTAAAAAWAAPDHASASRIATGVYLPGADWQPSLIDDYTNKVGRRPAIVHIYRDWSDSPFEPHVLDSIAIRGAMPLVTWEPWRDWSDGVSLWTIANGAEDDYIGAAARAAAAWGQPILLRFAHEMNGSWYPWGRGVNGNTPLAYRAAWRHLVRVFRREGAGNVRWVWTPYVRRGSRSFRRYYPGDRWVDWAGLDGFNWSGRFFSFAKIFGRSYRAMVKMTSKPLIVAETGSIEAGGSKPAWIRRALRRSLPRFRHIRALVWWSDVHSRGMDLRLETSPESLRAWAWALRAPRFNSGRKFLVSTPFWLRRR